MNNITKDNLATYTSNVASLAAFAQNSFGTGLSFNYPFDNVHESVDSNRTYQTLALLLVEMLNGCIELGQYTDINQELANAWYEECLEISSVAEKSVTRIVFKRFRSCINILFT